MHPLSRQTASGDVELVSADQKIVLLKSEQLAANRVEIAPRDLSATEKTEYAAIQTRLQAASNSLLGQQELFKKSLLQSESDSPDADRSFGYEFKVVADPEQPGAKAITAERGDSRSDVGGLEYDIELPALTAATPFSASLNVSTDFQQPESETFLNMDILDAQGQVLVSYITDKASGKTSQQRLEISGVKLPVTATKVRLFPYVRLAAGESGSFYWKRFSFSLEK